ncbi:MAG: hypothetical protein ACYC66_01010 [Chloroflexota bacterium]
MSRGYLGLMLVVIVLGVAGGAFLASTRSAPAPVVQPAAPFQSGASSVQPQNGGGSRQANGPVATPQGTSGAQDRARGQGQAGADARSRPLAGSVVSVEGDVATISTQQGEVQVKLSGATVQKTVEGTVEDVKPGQRVVVTAQQNPDGSYSASNLQIAPAAEASPPATPGPTPQATPSAG